MSLSRRKLIGSGIAGAAALGGVAASGKAAAGPTLQGKRLTLLAFQGPGSHVAFTIELLTEWAKSNGATLSTVTVPFSALLDKIMATIIAEDASVDAFYVDSGVMPFVAHGLAPIDPFLAQAREATAHIGPHLLELYALKGQHYGIPHESDAPLLIYRQDLFDSPAEQAAFHGKFNKQLRPPQTFDELTEAARFFYRKPGEKLAGEPVTNDFYGIALSGKPYISTARQWEMFLFGCGGRVLDDRYRPVFNDAAGIRATQIYTDFAVKYNVAEPGMAAVDAPGVDVLMNRGAAALAPIYPSGIPYQQAPGVRFNAVPWYSATEKGWSVCAHRASANVALVWEMVKFLNQRETQLKFGLMGAEPTRDDVLSDPKLVAHRPLLKALVDVHKRSRPQPQIPEISYIWNAESTPISEIVAQHVDVKQALNRTAKQIYDYLEQAGYYQ